MKIKSEFKTKQEAVDYLLKRGWMDMECGWFFNPDLGRYVSISKWKNKWYLDR